MYCVCIVVSYVIQCTIHPHSSLHHIAVYPNMLRGTYTDMVTTAVKLGVWDRRFARTGAGSSKFPAKVLQNSVTQTFTIVKVDAMAPPNPTLVGAVWHCQDRPKFAAVNQPCRQCHMYEKMNGAMGDSSLVGHPRRSELQAEWLIQPDWLKCEAVASPSRSTRRTIGSCDASNALVAHPPCCFTHLAIRIRSHRRRCSYCGLCIQLPLPMTA